MVFSVTCITQSLFIFESKRNRTVRMSLCNFWTEATMSRKMCIREASVESDDLCQQIYEFSAEKGGIT